MTLKLCRPNSAAWVLPRRSLFLISTDAKARIQRLCTSPYLSTSACQTVISEEPGNAAPVFPRLVEAAGGATVASLITSGAVSGGIEGEFCGAGCCSMLLEKFVGGNVGLRAISRSFAGSGSGCCTRHQGTTG